MLLGALVVALLTIEQVFGAQPPWGAQPHALVWAPDAASFLYTLPSQDTSLAQPVWQYDVGSGQSRVLIDPARYNGKPQSPAAVSWSPDSTRVAFTVNGTLYVRDMGTGLDRTIAKEAGDAQWSPKGDALAFTHDGNVYLARLTPVLRIRALTTDGVPSAILNGELDWVYPEELRIEHGFAFSPDGRYIAYLRLDERDVTNFPIPDYSSAENSVRHQRYPLAGGANPKASLHVIDTANDQQTTIYDAAAHDDYIAAFAWKPQDATIVTLILDRPQQHLRVIATGAHGGAQEVLYEQSSAQWVNVIPLPVWISPSQSLWVLERDGVRKLYLRSENGGFHALTGAFAVHALLGVDKRQGIAYVGAAYPTRRDRSLVAVPLSGDGISDITEGGYHDIALAPSQSLFVDTSSTLNEPPQTTLNDITGKTIATLAPRSASLKSQLLPVETLSVQSPHGPLDAYMIKPPEFDPSRKYPVVVYAYGGPQSPTTENAFGNMRQLYHQLLAQEGYIVFSIDGPASQIDNWNGLHQELRNFGPAALEGQEYGAAYLRSLPYVDSARIGIWGWSFGGYLALYALTHPSSFKAAIAGAPVTDWHFYDSIYTERYMGMPQREASAYDRSSDIVQAALHGDVLINHGSADDNVHVGNSIAFLDANAADARVDFALYPRQSHTFSSLPAMRGLYERMLAWWKAHL